MEGVFDCKKQKEEWCFLFFFLFVKKNALMHVEYREYASSRTVSAWQWCNKQILYPFCNKRKWKYIWTDWLFVSSSSCAWISVKPFPPESVKFEKQMRLLMSKILPLLDNAAGAQRNRLYHLNALGQILLVAFWANHWSQKHPLTRSQVLSLDVLKLPQLWEKKRKSSQHFFEIVRTKHAWCVDAHILSPSWKKQGKRQIMTPENSFVKSNGRQ